MPGVWTHGFVDMWSPGYLGFMSSNHNGMLRMYETFGNAGANTMKRTVNAVDNASGEGGGDMTTREWYRPDPAYKEVLWSMRNNTNYMETAALCALELTANFAKTVLENFYGKSRNSIQSGSKEAPYGYVLPAGQRDMTRVEFIVNALRLQGIEVGRAIQDVKLEDGVFPAGSFLVKRNQPYGRLAKILLETQRFPDISLHTYDDTGWTMGLMSNADVRETPDSAVLDVPVQPVDTLHIGGKVKGSGPWTAVLENGANSLATLRYRLKDLTYDATAQPYHAGDIDLPAGSLLVPSSARVKAEIEKLGLQAVALRDAPNVPKRPADPPRLALYSTWGSTQDVGWVRYAFDHFEMTYDLIYQERVRQGRLREAYDVIVIPDQAHTAKGLVFDLESKGKPLAYTKTPEFPTLGQYGESPDITGGMGLEGVVELERFVRAGGVLITLGVSSFFPAEFGITRTVDAGRPSAQFYAPGPIVEAEIVQPAHPIFYGYPQRTAPVRYANGPLLGVPAEARSRWVLMQFQGTERSVLSGLLRGVGELRGRPAVADVPVGQGHVILFATNPCYRWQNLGEFGMLSNAVLYWNHLPRNR
jgi:hypothetical protein